MEKYVRYCPICDKYYSRWDLLCDFCLRDNIPLAQWESMTKKEKEAWKDKTKPRRNIDELDPDFKKDIQAKANAFDAQYRKELEEKEHPKYVPTCPTCGCPDIEKISAGAKAVDVALFGLWGSNKRKLQFRCKNCGYEW